MQNLASLRTCRASPVSDEASMPAGILIPSLRRGRSTRLPNS